MSAIKLLHAADLHLDSPFEALPAGKAAIRRREQRELLDALARLAAAERVDLVLLSGDLLDSGTPYFETGEELAQALRSIPAAVFIAPGNHDYYSPKSPYARLQMPENVHIFTENRSGPLLRGFRTERRPGGINLLCLHGDFGAKDSPYDPISEAELQNSGIDYAALGHIHKASGLRKAGETWYSWPGCPEGRGFDETGEKYVNLVELENGECRLRQVSIAGRRYEQLQVDVTGADPLLAIHSSLPDDTVCDVYRITLTGETETAPDLRKLYANLAELFFELQLRDETRLRHSVWDSAGEDTLRGLFLSRLKTRYDAAKTEEERRKLEQAARWGLAALDNAEEVAQHEDQ